MTNSIYKQFYQKLILATSVFVVALAFIFYSFTKATIYEDISNDILKDAKLLYKVSQDYAQRNPKLPFKVFTNPDIKVDLVCLPNQDKMKYSRYSINNNHFMEIIYPFDMSKKLFLKITKNINNSYKLLNKIFGNMLILGTGGLMLIVLYAFAVSKTLLRPIINITKRLSNMDERSLDKINIDTLPIEFGPLANSINNLTNKIENYLRYQKELFIGTAHELKTPLAVMKLKSEIILRKSRQIEEYKKSLELNISEINKIDKVISSVLDMGRQESAQFEKPIDIDIITFLRGKIEDYNLIAKTKMINIAFNTNKDHFLITLQPTLLTQIVQNFVQNAIKFTNNNKNIEVRANTNNSSIIIEVIDEGIGLHSDIDLFAPFVREGKSSGAGLGLFLAKSAANTLGASISISNRKDNIQGTISTLVLDINPTCKI